MTTLEKYSVPENKTKMHEVLKNLKDSLGKLKIDVVGYNSEKDKKSLQTELLGKYIAKKIIEDNSTLIITKAEISIGGEIYKSIGELELNDIKKEVKEYLIEDAYRDELGGKNLLEGMAIKLNADPKIKQADLKKDLGNIEGIKGLISDKLGPNISNALNFLGDEEVKKMGVSIKGLMVLKGNTKMLTKVSFLDNLKTEYPSLSGVIDNINNMNPLLKGAAVIFVLFKSISYVNKFIGKNGGYMNWLQYWGGSEIIGQIATGESLSSKGIGYISKMFSSSSDKDKILESLKSSELNRKNENNNKVNYKILTITLLGLETDVAKMTNLNWITSNDGTEEQKNIINLLLSSNKVTKKKLKQNVKKGLTDILRHYNLNQSNLNEMLGKNLIEKINKLSERSKELEKGKNNLLKTLNEGKGTSIELTELEVDTNYIIAKKKYLIKGIPSNSINFPDLGCSNVKINIPYIKK